MIQDKIKIWSGLIFATFLASSLAGCASDTATNSSGAEVGAKDKLTNSVKTVQKTLLVNEQRCTGCGKCSRFDSEHFSFDNNTRKAKVISQENLSSNKLTMAISACHDRAISLE